MAIAIFLGFVFVMGVLVAQEPAPGKPAESAQSAASPQPSRDSLRYDGKSFDDWRTSLLTELKPERRCEPITALGALGANGYAIEAATALIDAVRGYKVAVILESRRELTELEKSHEKVVREALGSMREIGASALPVLDKAMSDESADVRRFALAALWLVDADEKTVVRRSTAALEDKSPLVRKAALEYLESHCFHASDETEFVALYAKVLRLPDEKLREWAVHALYFRREKAKVVTQILLDALNDEAPAVRKEALTGLAEVYADPKIALPRVTPALKDDDSDVRLAALRYIHQYIFIWRDDAKDAVPALIEALKRQQEMSKEVIEIAHALARLGSAAKEAAPALKATSKWNSKHELNPEISQALQAIGDGP
jgi:HEAT repeat protein